MSAGRDVTFGESRMRDVPGAFDRDSFALDTEDARAIPMVGDPVFLDCALDALTVRRACQYAAAMLLKVGALSGDLSRFDAQLIGANTISFVSADREQREVARFVVPPRVMAFSPHKPALRLADEREV